MGRVDRRRVQARRRVDADVVTADRDVDPAAPRDERGRAHDDTQRPQSTELSSHAASGAPAPAARVQPPAKTGGP
jgi:hypothetical protein